MDNFRASRPAESIASASRAVRYPGELIGGRYRLDAPVADGGMGSVYRATEMARRGGELRPVRTVAVKFIRPAVARDAAFVAWFERETDAVVAIQHPNVVPVFEAGEHEGEPFLAMAWIDGEDLGGLIATRGPMPLTDAIRLLWPIADALDAAHERGLVHCDVKPGNILVSRRGDVYLGDFGLAVPATGIAAGMRTRTVLGSASSMAPEQARGEPPDPSLAGRIDVYGLACVVYACLTGAGPFRGSPEQVIRAHGYAAPPALRSARPDLPSAVDEVLAQALDKAPWRRHASCRAFLAALAAAGRVEAAAAAPVAASAPTTRVNAARQIPARARAPGRVRRAARVGARAAGTLVVLLVAVTLLRPSPAGSDAPTPTRLGRFGTDAAQAALAGRVPDGESCEAVELAAAEVAALSCPIDGAVAAGYALYEDVEGLREDWAGIVEEAGFEPDSTLGCQIAEGETAWHLASDPFSNPGRILCYTDRDGATIAWTDERHLVRGYVVTDQADMAAARDLWRRAFLA